MMIFAILDYAMVGPALALGLSAFGSAIGCSYGFMAALGVMSRSDENHSKYIGLAAIPASQTIYGVVLTMLMRGALIEGTIGALSAIGIGVGAGLAFFASSVFQGKVSAASIQAIYKQPSLFGKTAVGLGIIESFALFALVFGIFLLK